MIFIKKKYILLLTILLTTSLSARRIPRLTLAIVVDQLSYQKLMSLRPYLKGGLHDILQYGVVYHNAYQPHGMPATSVGHTALSTGTYAKSHGICGNGWYNDEGIKINCDEDTAENAAVFSPTGMHDYGKSAHNLLVDTITDQFMLAAPSHAQHTAYSISLKSRSAICTAGRLGKPLWFDDQTGWFTSSKAYFDKLPHWLIRFNKKKDLQNLKSITWHRAFENRDYPYRMFNKNVDEIGLFGKTIPIDHTKKNPYHHFLQTPTANNLVFELARICVDEHLSKNPDDKMLLWICPSALDKAGHEFGQDSVQVTDLIYHLDKEIFRFYNYVTKHIRKKDVLVVVTADHGSGYEPEKMAAKGMTLAHRVISSTIKHGLNEAAYKQSGYTNLITGIKAPNIFFNMKKLDNLSSEKRKKTLEACKQYLLEQPGIKHAWTYDELQTTLFDNDALALYYKHQAYPGRFGQIIAQPAPYSFITPHTTGTSHKSPYDYDTHIPLIIYQPGSHEGRNYYEKVLSVQCAPTLAYLLNIPRPSASTAPTLPGITPTNDPCF